MKYEHTIKARLLDRPNRFIAHVELNQEIVICHVKNTGRCKELLLPGAAVVLEYHPDWESSGRRTAYDLVAVYKGNLLINMDSQAPNRAAWEWINQPEAASYLADTMKPAVIPPRLFNPRREVSHGDSRFDLAFSLEQPGGRAVPAFMEVKGVTLEENGAALFPDAPTERGVKHLLELQRAVERGCRAFCRELAEIRQACPEPYPGVKGGGFCSRRAGDRR